MHTSLYRRESRYDSVIHCTEEKNQKQYCTVNLLTFWDMEIAMFKATHVPRYIVIS